MCGHFDIGGQRGWSYPLQAVPKKFRSRKPKDAIKMTVTGMFYIYILTRHCFLFLFLLQRWRQRQQKWQQWQTTKSWQAMNGLWASGCMTATTAFVHKLCL
jgi:hypothetical protein